jgi:hypothetical protein
MTVKIQVDTAIEVFVNIVPLMNSNDFITINEAIVFNQAGMDLNWNFITTAGVVTQTNVVPTTAGSYDWAHVGNGMYKIEIPASGGASINNDREGVGWFSGVCTGVLAWVSPQYEFSPANVVNSLVNGTDYLQADAVQIEGADATNTLDARVQAVIETNKLDHLVAVADADDVTTNSIIAKLAASDGDWSGFDLATDSLEATRDHATTIKTDTAAILVDTGTDGVLLAADAITSTTIATSAITEINDGAAILNGTAQANVNPNVIILAIGASAVDDYYNGNLVTIRSGTGANQARLIVDYDGASKTATVDNAWLVTPTAGSIYRVFPFSGILLADTGVAAAIGAATITLAASAVGVADTYVGHTIYISGGTGVGQARLITAYTALRVATVSPAWTTPLGADSIYKLLPVGRTYVNAFAPGSLSNATLAADMELRLTKLDAANLPTDITNIQGRLPAALVGGNIIADVLAISGSTDAADKLEASAETMVIGQAVAGTLSITQMTTNLTEVTNGHYNGRVIIWTSGVLIQQATDIIAYDGVTKMLTYTAITEAPGIGDTFVIV